jgi:glycosyltransferase involved in cell wall biosynthesis
MVSVIIPCYNAGDTIIESVESVFAQTYKDIEIIIVDDGSTDNSIEILKNYLAQNGNSNKVNIISQENKGPSAARNRGIGMAKGNYIAFLDSDDIWKSNKVEIQVQILNQDKEAYLIGCIYNDNQINETNEIVEITFRHFLKKNFFPTPTVVARSEVFEEFKFNENQKYSEDYRLWLRISKKYKCLLVNQSLTNSISQKLEYGYSGLSSNLWQMEKGELGNFFYIYKEGSINGFQLLYYNFFSLLKYFRRRVISFYYRKKYSSKKHVL